MIRGGSVKQVASKLREHEDFNLALKLQEEEFNNHYDRNRIERKVMGVDTKKSKEEQEKLKREAIEKRMKEYSEIAKRDEELAKRIQMEYEMEEKRRQDEQAKIDADIARRLHMENDINDEHYDMTPIPYEEDETLARELQERYLRRLSNARGTLDPTTQSELSYYVGRQMLSPPEDLMPRRSTPGPPGIEATHFSPIAAIPPTTTVIDTSLLPPLPSYNDICAPTTTVATTTVHSDSGISTAAISPSTTNILTSAGNAAIPARAPLHPIVNNPAPTVTNLPDNVNSSNTQTYFNPEQLHATNPFLQDLLLSQYNANNPSSSTSNSARTDEFGLPPFSELYHSTANVAPDQQSSSRRIPQGAVPLIPNMDQSELRSRIGQNQ